HKGFLQLEARINRPSQSCDCNDRQQDENRCHLAGPSQLLDRPCFLLLFALPIEQLALAFLLLKQLQPGLLRCFLLMTAITAGANHSRQQVMGQLEALHSTPVFTPQQPAFYQLIDGLGCDSGKVEGILQGDAVAKTGIRQQAFFDETSHLDGKVTDGALVEVAENLVATSFEQALSNFRFVQLLPLAIQLATDPAQERRLDLKFFKGNSAAACPDKAHNLLRYRQVNEALSLGNHLQCGLSVHSLKTKAIQGNTGHALTQGFQFREKVLTNAQDQFVAMTGK